MTGRPVALGGAVLLLLAAPIMLPPYYLGLLTKMCIMALFAMSFDVLLGYTALPSLGHAVYFGVGAYTVALVTRAGASPVWLPCLAAVAAAAVLAAGFGLLTLRTRGTYYLMITLALAQVVWGIAVGWRSFTGGDDGMAGIGRPTLVRGWSLDGEVAFYYFVVAACALSAAALGTMVASPFGKALRGIRESETRMQVLGYNVWGYKYAASIAAGAFAGLAGALFVYYNGYVGPAYLSIVLSAEVFLMTLLGGAGTLFGPAVGAGTIVLLENLVSAWTERWLLILGAIYVAVTLGAPRGLYGLVVRRRAAPQS